MKRLHETSRNVFVGNVSQQLHRDVGTSLRVGEGVVVVLQIETAGFGNGVQLMVGQFRAEVPSGGLAGAAEPIVGVIHLVGLEHGFQAAFVEGTVVRHEGKSGNQWLDLLPYSRKGGGVNRIFRPQAVNLPAEPRVVVGYGMDEAVEGVGDNAVAHDHYADTAHAAALSVGGFEVNSCKVFHLVRFCADISGGKSTIFYSCKDRVWICQKVT